MTSASIIEKFDKQRYWAVVLEAAGLLLLCLDILVAYIQIGADPHMFLIGGVHIITPIGALLLVTGGLWYGILWLRIRKDPAVKSSLYNEMYRQHKYRYQRYTLWFMMGVSILSMCIPPLTYPHILRTEVIILTSLIFMKTLWLIYNRR